MKGRLYMSEDQLEFLLYIKQLEFLLYINIFIWKKEHRERTHGSCWE